jgi:hypothetical protein
MHGVEEEVSLSQPETIAVPPEEEEAPVLQGPTLAVLLEEQVPPEEEEVPAPLVPVPPQGPTVMVPLEEEVPQGPTIAVPPEEEEVLAPLVAVPPEGRGCLVPVSPLVSFSPFFFLKNTGDSSSPFFS